MPELTWLGKDAIRHHHLEVPYRPFVPTATFEAPGTAADAPLHRIIHGDNLDALKSLLPEFEGRVKCIYIDPPYNTGNEQWAYNDNVNDPRLLAWLGHTVGKEAEDLTRHDKWLCMMYPRLQLLRKLLSEDGIIFISIDDNEVGHLRPVMDEIFGPSNFLGQFTWVRKKKGAFLSKKIRKMTEYILAFQKNSSFPLTLYGEGAYAEKWQPLVKRTNQLKQLAFSPNLVTTTLPDGIYKAFKSNEDGTGVTFIHDFEVKIGRVVSALTVEGRFVWSQDFLDKEVAAGTQVSLSKKYGFNVLRFDQADKIKAPSTLITIENGVGTNEDATAELADIFDSEVGASFQYAKPVTLPEYLIQACTFDPAYADSIILDSFAGSGTTLHAVAKLNARDGGRRRCILVEVQQYADTLTAERARRVLTGYGTVPGLSGRFEFGKLGGPLFDTSTGLLDAAAPLPALRQYVWWQETSTQLPPFDPTAPSDHPAYLGTTTDGTRIYFDYHPAQPSALTTDWLGGLTVPAPRFVVYADSCEVNSDWLALHNVVYKKIPRDLVRL